MQRRSVRSVAVAALVLSLFLGACGGSDDDELAPESATPTTPVEAPEQTGNVTRFCELTAELDEAGSKFFAKLEKDDNATSKDYEDAEKAFAEAHEADFTELVAAAPAEVKDDVTVVLASISARAGLGPKVPQKDATAAEDNLLKFEDANC
jgi:hypothetical protein